MGNRNEYHLAELKVAADPGHPAHCLPVVPPGATVLDVGCGAGQTLIAACPNRIAFGVDVDLAALHLGRQLTAHVRFACASAEALPFREGVFDMVISRVALPYTHIPRALAEIRRVLKPAGQAWLTLHSWRIPWQGVKDANWKGRVFLGYVILNGLLLHFTQRLLRFPGRGYESFQTSYGIVRALRRAGFRNILMNRGKAHFVVTAASADCT